MSSLHTAQQVLWLDPVQPLDAPEHAQLTAAGLSVRCIQTLDELQSALSHGQTAALVLRHDTTLDLLQSCQNLMLRAVGGLQAYEALLRLAEATTGR